MIRPWAVLGVPLALAWACVGGVLGAGPQWWFVAVGVVLFVGPMLVAEAWSWHQRRLREEWRLGYECGHQSAALAADSMERHRWPTFEWRDGGDSNGLEGDVQAPPAPIGHVSVFDGHRFVDAPMFPLPEMDYELRPPRRII